MWNTLLICCLTYLTFLLYHCNFSSSFKCFRLISWPQIQFFEHHSWSRLHSDVLIKGWANKNEDCSIDLNRLLELLQLLDWMKSQGRLFWFSSGFTNIIYIFVGVFVYKCKQRTLKLFCLACCACYLLEESLSGNLSEIFGDFWWPRNSDWSRVKFRESLISFDWRDFSMK